MGYFQLLFFSFSIYPQVWSGIFGPSYIMAFDACVFRMWDLPYLGPSLYVAFFKMHLLFTQCSLGFILFIPAWKTPICRQSTVSLCFCSSVTSFSSARVFLLTLDRSNNTGSSQEWISMEWRYHQHILCSYNNLYLLNLPVTIIQTILQVFFILVLK